MIKQIALSLLATGMFLTGVACCSLIPNTKKEKPIPPVLTTKQMSIEVSKIRQQFETIVRGNTKSIPIYLVDMKEETGYGRDKAVGFCRYHVSKGKRVRSHIFIDKYYWLEISQMSKKELLFHELAHCYLELGHNEALLPDDCPQSIMYPKVIEQHCIKSHWDDVYLKEFENASK